MSVQGMGGAAGGPAGGATGLPPARSPAEMDSARQVYGQALVAFGQEILSPQPDPLLMAQLEKVIMQVTDAMASARAEFQGSQEMQSQGSTIQSGVPQPARKPADSMTRRSL